MQEIPPADYGTNLADPPPPPADCGISPADRRIKSYVLRAGRMSAAQQRSYNTLLSRWEVQWQPEPLDFQKIFGNDQPCIIEIGFGMGIATALIAESRRDRNYIGIEVHRPGIGRLLWEIEHRGLENLRIIESDAVPVLKTMIPNKSVEGFHLFFPDPWPKKRHHKRRLIQRPFTDMLAAKLASQGYVYVVTDWEDYGAWALEALSGTPGLSNRYAGFAPPQPWRPQTAFERKGREKRHEVWELFFTSLAESG